MASRVSAQQAACNALAVWLKSQMPEVTVEDRWPEGELPADDQGHVRAVTVLLVGAPVDQALDPEIVSSTPNGDGTDSTVYQYRCRRQHVELDVWASYDVDRDELVATLDDVLNASDNLTQPDVFNADPVRNGLRLPLSDGFDGSQASFYFDGPENIDTPDAHQQSELRATYRGYVDVMLAKTVTTVPLTTAILRQKAHPEVVTPTDLPTEVTTVTATTETHTIEPP